MRDKTELERRLADAVSSGGVSFSRVAVEILYLLPDDLVQAYSELFHLALNGADGGAGARGESDRRKGGLGKAAGLPSETVRRGGRIKTGESTRAIGRAAAPAGTYRGVWTIGNEQALRLKQRIDKRLRGIARDIREELDMWEERMNGSESRRGSESGGAGDGTAPLNVCARCKRFLEQEANYCSWCGAISRVGWERVQREKEKRRD